MVTLRRALGWAVASAAAYGVLVEPRRVVVRAFDVTLDNLPPSAEGLRVAQMSDLHLSALTGRAHIRRAVEICNAQQPDVVVVTGDFVSRRGSYNTFTGARIWARPAGFYGEQVRDELARLRAPQGVFGVLGNHDHTHGSGAWLEKLLREAGVETLSNRAVRVRGLHLAGVDDWRSGRPDLRAALGGIGTDEALLLLSHNPRVLWLLRDRPALVLAGHTHGGQVRVPGLPLQRGYWPSDIKGNGWTRGWYALGRAKLYVNAGLGSVNIPLRLGSPPEIAVFTLRGSGQLSG